MHACVQVGGVVPYQGQFATLVWCLLCTPHCCMVWSSSCCELTKLCGKNSLSHLGNQDVFSFITALASLGRIEGSPSSCLTGSSGPTWNTPMSFGCISWTAPLSPIRTESPIAGPMLMCQSSLQQMGQGCWAVKLLPCSYRSPNKWLCRGPQNCLKQVCIPSILLISYNINTLHSLSMEDATHFTNMNSLHLTTNL